MRYIALIACAASLALGPSAAAQAPDEPAHIVEAKPARQVVPPLPVVAARTSGEPLLHLDALDAPAEALAVLLGGRLLTTRSSGLRFTGRMDAGRAADALAALREALPQLASVDLIPGEGTGRPVSVRLVDADSRDLDRLVAQVSGAPFTGCGVGVRVTAGVRDVPVDVLAAALSAHYARIPRCAAAPAATSDAPAQPRSAAPESPQPGWRLVATLRDGTTRKAIFEAADGALHVFADRGAWDDVFLRFERGRVVMPGPTVHALAPAPTRRD